jgi:TolB protein
MSSKISLCVLFVFGFTLPRLNAQEPQQVTIGITPLENIILAVADVQPATAEKPVELSNALKTFNQVLWDDLSFSGFFTLAGKSFYPPQPIVRPDRDLDYDAWSALPFKVSFLTVGTLNLMDGVLRAELSIVDMKQRQIIPGKRYIGDADQIRTIAHWWADEVVYKLTAGASRGIASTKIAYVSKRGVAKDAAKEIYVMDYDGYDQRAFTHNGALNLFPNWAPDNSKLAFVSYRTGPPEINIYSYINGSRLPFPLFNTYASTPAISPDGTEVVFSLRTPRGDADLFISKLDGSGRHNITNNPAVDSSPTWSPSGRQIAFTSDRQGGTNQVFICDADGSNIRRVVKEGGDADAPAWSPDGRWLAFHWKPRMSSAYDLFIADVASGAIRQLTSNSGSNESPSWAPDGRHIVFQSNRTGSEQIYIILLDGSEPRRLTDQGSNSSPAWGGYFRREGGN